VILEFNLAVDYSSINALYKQAEEAISTKNTEEALKLLDQCIALNPYNEIYFSTRSGIHREMGNIEASQMDILRARKLKNELLSYMVISGISL
jgi:predicted Zn-dependent protease